MLSKGGENGVEISTIILFFVFEDIFIQIIEESGE